MSEEPPENGEPDSDAEASPGGSDGTTDAEVEADSEEAAADTGDTDPDADAKSDDGSEEHSTEAPGEADGDTRPDADDPNGSSDPDEQPTSEDGGEESADDGAAQDRRRNPPERAAPREPQKGASGRTVPPSHRDSGSADADASDPDAPDADDADSSAEDARSSSSPSSAPSSARSAQTDRGGSPVAGRSTATGAAEAGGGGGGGIFSGGIGASAPPDDEEMPLTEHIEEMLTRLTVVVLVAAVATVVAFPLANDIIVEMWYDVHSGSVEACQADPEASGCVPPHVYGPLELVLTRIRVSALAGLLVALPLAVYQTYRFMRPGLYPHERRYYLAAVPFSLVLGILGMVFAYFVLLPLLFEYFISYTEGSADLAFQLAETMNLVLVMMGMLAIIFQIPLLIMLAIMMGITTREWLERRRLYFWGIFLGVAVLFGPDPTGMAPMMLTATMVVLFEATLLLLRWTGR